MLNVFKTTKAKQKLKTAFQKKVFASYFVDTDKHNTELTDGYRVLVEDTVPQAATRGQAARGEALHGASAQAAPWRCGENRAADGN